MIVKVEEIEVVAADEKIFDMLKQQTTTFYHKS